LGREYMRRCGEHELVSAEVALETALALGDAGEYAEAVARLQPGIEQAEQLGRLGFSSGVLYEARARLAIGMHDREAFETYARRCEREYERAKNPALGTQLTQLHEQAQAAGVYTANTAYVAPRSLSPAAPETELESIHSRIAECVDAADRARCALTLLLEATNSVTGYLYEFGADRQARLVAALPDVPSDAGIEGWVEQHANAWWNPSHADDATADGTSSSTTADVTGGSSATADPDANAAPRYIDLDGRTLEPVLLIGDVASRRVLAGVLVLQTTPEQRIFPPRSLCATIAHELLAHGDAGEAP
jgi:hypothetical protein